MEFVRRFGIPILAWLIVSGSGMYVAMADDCGSIAEAMFPESLLEGSAVPPPPSYACQHREREDAVLPDAIVAGYATRIGDCVRLLAPNGDDTWRVESEFCTLESSCSKVTLKTTRLGPAVADGVAVEFCGGMGDIWLFDISDGSLRIVGPTSEDTLGVYNLATVATLIDLGDSGALDLVLLESGVPRCLECKDVYSLRGDEYTYAETLRWFGTYNANADGSARAYEYTVELHNPSFQYALRILNGPTFDDPRASEFTVKWNGEPVASEQIFSGTNKKMRLLPIQVRASNSLEVEVAGGSVAVSCELIESCSDLQPLKPTVACVLAQGGFVEAWVGYDNPNRCDVYLPPGPNNRFRPNDSEDEDVNQPSAFLAGRHDGVARIFEHVGEGNDLTWYLDGNVLRIVPGEVIPCIDNAKGE